MRNRISAILASGIFVGAAWAMSTAPAFGQEYMALLGRFRSLGVPVMNVVVDEGIPVAAVRYDPGADIDGAAIEKMIISVFGEMARAFPDSQALRMESFVGMDLVTTLEAKTSDASEFARGSLGAGEFIGRLRFPNGFDMETRLESATPGPGSVIDVAGAYSAAFGDLPEPERPLAKGESVRTAAVSDQAGTVPGWEELGDKPERRSLAPVFLIAGLCVLMSALAVIFLRHKRKADVK